MIKIYKRKREILLMKNRILRGDVLYVDLGSERKAIRQQSHIQAGKRPVIVVSNDIGNYHSPVIIVVPLTTAKKHDMPTHYHFNHKKSYGTALCEQIFTISKKDIIEKIDHIYPYEMMKISDCLVKSLGIEKI